MILDKIIGPEQRAVSYQDVWGKGGDFFGATTDAGVEVDALKAMEQRAVYACVSLIAESISTLPAKFFIPEGDQRIPLPDPMWLKRFNHDCEVSDGWAQILTSLLLEGNAYALTPRTSSGEVGEVIPLDPRIVKVDRDSKGLFYEIDEGSKNTVVRNETLSTMTHVRALRWPGQLVGMSPIQAAKQAVGLGIAAESFGALFFGQGATPSGVLETDADLSPEAAQALAAAWKRTHGGLRKAWLPAVLKSGLKWKQTSVANRESQFLELREFQVAEIAGFYRVPPHMIGSVERSTSWGTGIEQQSIAFVVYTLRPWIVRIEQAFGRLAPPELAAAEMRFNVSGLLRGDAKSRFEAYSLGRNGGWLSADDIRALEDMAPLPGGQGETYLQPLNMTSAAEGDQSEGAP